MSEIKRGIMSYQERYETLVGEHLKSAMEQTLSIMGAAAVGRAAIEYYAFGSEGRLVDPSLFTVIGGVALENPVVIAAGWDKKGHAVRGLYCLGAAGTEVGTVPEFGQPGNSRPRLWTINPDHSVGLNRLGFNSIGAEGVEKKLQKHAEIPGVLGINVGKNKELTDEHSPEYHAKVVARFNPMASYFVFNPSSPNTPGLTEKQKKGPMRDHLAAIMEVARRPVFVKYGPDIDYKDLDESIEVVIESGCAGLVLTNTTSDEQIKAQYGSRWAKEAGGLSGDDPQYRAKATAILSHAYEEYGDQLDMFGVGGVKDVDTALEKIKSGGSAVQVLTAIRSSRGKVVAQINSGLSSYMKREGVHNIQELIGIDTKRGVRPKAA